MSLHFKIALIFQEPESVGPSSRHWWLAYERAGDGGSLVGVVGTALEDIHKKYDGLPQNPESCVARAPHSMAKIGLGSDC